MLLVSEIASSVELGLQCFQRSSVLFHYLIVYVVRLGSIPRSTVRLLAQSARLEHRVRLLVHRLLLSANCALRVLTDRMKVRALVNSAGLDLPLLRKVRSLTTLAFRVLLVTFLLLPVRLLVLPVLLQPISRTRERASVSKVNRGATHLLALRNRRSVPPAHSARIHLVVLTDVFLVRR